MQTTEIVQSPPHALGFDPMDAIHDEFLVRVQELTQADEAVVLQALDALAEHVHTHFAAEEEWMRSTAFPAPDCHAAEHAAVLASVEGVQRRARSGDTAPARSLARALADWFPNHADYMDAALAHWMCERRFGGRPVVLHRPRPSAAAPAER